MRHHHPKPHLISGEILATGDGAADVKFDEKPHDVFVFFCDEPNPTPCDPGSEDILSWSLYKHRHSHHWVLEIIWSVASQRMIKWQAREKEF